MQIWRQKIDSEKSYDILEKYIAPELWHRALLSTNTQNRRDTDISKTHTIFAYFWIVKKIECKQVSSSLSLKGVKASLSCMTLTWSGCDKRTGSVGWSCFVCWRRCSGMFSTLSHDQNFEQQQLRRCNITCIVIATQWKHTRQPSRENFNPTIFSHELQQLSQLYSLDGVFSSGNYQSFLIQLSFIAILRR